MEKSIDESNLNIMLRSNFNPDKLSKCTDFYRHVLKNWTETKYNHEITGVEISNQYIFYNDVFSIDKKNDL